MHGLLVSEKDTQTVPFPITHFMLSSFLQTSSISLPISCVTVYLFFPFLLAVSDVIHIMTMAFQPSKTIDFEWFQQYGLISWSIKHKSGLNVRGFRLRRSWSSCKEFRLLSFRKSRVQCCRTQTVQNKGRKIWGTNWTQECSEHAITASRNEFAQQKRVRLHGILSDCKQKRWRTLGQHIFL